MAPRQRVAGAVDASGRALRLWLLGQLAAMVSVGILTGLGLWIIGVPSAFALALLAGLADFVPLVGPIVAAVPALLIALSEGWETMLWTLLLYVLVQQIESNLIVPIAQRRTVSLPPAITLFPAVRAAGRAVRDPARGGRAGRGQEAVGVRGARRADRGAGRTLTGSSPRSEDQGEQTDHDQEADKEDREDGASEELEHCLSRGSMATASLTYLTPGGSDPAASPASGRTAAPRPRRAW